ncbi:type II toxin-antitoxin system RatA family toxin [Nocardia rhizosphaerae]|uniref:Type II toxin-antitoxin system RatA family toxin n=1 Tax=Nocardia rhizosphaerae TaxID=1691571 RepID=A0ABV8L9D4_9NOCA
MPEYSITATTTASAEATFALISDFRGYPTLVPEVIVSLTVDEGGDPPSSEWAVRFHGGILKWREHDAIDTSAHRIEFRQIAGDFADFAGAWQVSGGRDRPTRVSLHVTFDLGMPAVADVLEPIAHRAFDEAMRALLTALLGRDTTFAHTASAAQHPAVSA